MQMDFDISSISAIIAAIGVLVGVILTVLERARSVIEDFFTNDI